MLEVSRTPIMISKSSKSKKKNWVTINAGNILKILIFNKKSVVCFNFYIKIPSHIINYTKPKWSQSQF
jgi:hypothetical protein